MKILLPDSTGMMEATRILREGGVIAHATETCYGFACDLSNAAAVAKLFAIKQRPVHQPVSALFASVEDAEQYVQWNAEAEKLAEEFLPGPLTIILLTRSDAPRALFCIPPPTEPQTLGVRISSHPLAQQLVDSFGSPLSTTSANLHGQPNPYSAQEVVAQFAGQRDQPDLILDSGKIPQRPPSTVIDCTGMQKGIRRKGSIQPK